MLSLGSQIHVVSFSIVDDKRKIHVTTKRFCGTCHEDFNDVTDWPLNPCGWRTYVVTLLVVICCRGFYSLEILRQLENFTGKRIVDMFDVICGVSAGALVCTLLGASNLSISQCESHFRKFSKQMFSQSKVPGISKLISTHSYYNTEVFESVLKYEPFVHNE